MIGAKDGGFGLRLCVRVIYKSIMVNFEMSP